MTTTYSHSALETQPSTDLKAMLAEPFLIVGVSAFWALVLPFAAVSMLGVKAWDTAAAFTRRSARSNPLILRRGEAGKNAPAPASAKRI